MSNCYWAVSYLNNPRDLPLASAAKASKAAKYSGQLSADWHSLECYYDLRFS